MDQLMISLTSAPSEVWCQKLEAPQLFSGRFLQDLKIPVNNPRLRPSQNQLVTSQSYCRADHRTLIVQGTVVTYGIALLRH